MKTILITGANGFLGTALKNKLKDQATVIGIDIDDVNIAKEDEVEDYVAYLASTGITLNGLINNAAISYKGLNITNEQFEKTLQTNIIGTHNCIKHFRNIMVKDSSIVNIGSIYGSLSPDPKIYKNDATQYNSCAYGSSKAALTQMTKYYAVHYAPEIRVNMVSPGGIFNNQSKEFVKAYNDTNKSNANTSFMYITYFFMLLMRV